MSGWLLAGFFPAGAAEGEKKLLGEGNDGNRSEPIHLITLFDEKGMQIKETDEKAHPASMRKTCGECHKYDLIAKGWHFDSGSSNPPAGRIGEPWVLTDSKTRTQIPVSNRPWPGAHKPAELKMSSWQYLKQFASHFPGGDYGEMPPAENDQNADPAEILRWPISGTYEINCLACHHADRRQDQSEAALQAARQNYRWAASAASGLAVIKGTASELDDFYDPETEYKIQTLYDKSRFDGNSKVFLDIRHTPPANRCYFCHSVQDMEKTEAQEWTRDQDVHLAAGLTCADCHRNGVDHMISRGDLEKAKGGPGEVSTLSCQGCHLGDQSANNPAALHSGRLGAPYPEHAGIPTIHFEVLSCTACHSGPYPKEDAGLVRTARLHQLGLHGKHHVDLKLPHVYSPVFVRNEHNRIAPHRLFWPAFWGTRKEGGVKALVPEAVKEMAGDELGEESETDERVNDWKPLTLEQIGKVLQAIAAGQEKSDQPKPEPVYVAGGKLYRLAGDKVVAEEHESAKPYSWPLAHDVRPASQSLGVNGQCRDCHDMKASFFFGRVSVDSPLATKEKPVLETKEMVEFEGVNRTYHQLFALSFLFRPWLKIFVLAACAVLGLVLLFFVLQAVGFIAKAAAEKKE